MMKIQNFSINSNLYSNNYKNQQSNYFSSLHKDKVHFRGVSINGPEDENDKTPKSSAQVFADQIVNKVNSFAEANSSSMKEIDKNLEELADEMNRRREKVSNADLIDAIGHMIKGTNGKIDKEEIRRRYELLRKKGVIVDKALENAKEAQKIADEMPLFLAQFDNSNDIERQKKLDPIQRRKKVFDELKGFSRIAGYQDAKNILEEYFIEKIRKEKAGKESRVPGSVLFFGPMGNGKTTFASAFAEETGCKIIPIRVDPLLSQEQRENQFINKLMDVSEKAEQRFRKDKTRTIIFIDEITKVINDTSTIMPAFEEFLKTCSDKYHCTVFAATNYPFHLGIDMAKTTNFPYRVSMETPNRENKIAVLMHYLNNRTSEEIDYDILTDNMERKEKETYAAFSNGQIEKICMPDDKMSMSQQDLLDSINKSTPAVSMSDLDKFNQEEAHFMTHKITNK